jgi:hypothetical protein
MVIEERPVQGYSSLGGQYIGGHTGSAFPTSMGPGARPVEGNSLPEGQYNGGNTGSTFPKSIGPGAIVSSQPEFREEGAQASPSSMLQQVQGIRSHYSFEVRDRTLFLGYDLRGAGRGYSLPFANMPLSGMSAWLLYGGPMRARVTSTFVIDTIRGAENLAHRPLTQTEAEGYAHYASRRTLYSFASSISAVWIGSLFAIYGRKTMKFPFRKPRPLERYDNFPNRWLPVLRGNYARIAWQITRFNVYTILSLALIAPVYSSMGDSAMMVGLYRDPRTHEVTKGMAAALKNTNGRLQRHASNRPTASTKPIPDAGDMQDDHGFYSSSEQGAANDFTYGKDYGSDTAYTDSTTDTGVLGDSQAKGRDARQQSPTAFTGTPAFRQKPVQQPSPAFRNRPGAQPDPDSDDSTDPDFIFDDASPTARNDPAMDASSGFSKSSSGNSGSAWERIRKSQTEKGAKGGITSPGSRQASPGPRTGQTAWKEVKDSYETTADSFSFSSSEREKQLAKEQAQKDFDKMLEEERKGVDGGAAGFGGAWGRRRGE